ncbi:MAG: VCBS repeat-containing protein [Isosphaeraceae bacterium]
MSCVRASRARVAAAVLAWAFLLLAAGRTASPAEPAFERRVIDPDFPGAYQVEVADVDGDKRPDIIAVGGGTCAWYQNPTWKKRVVSGPDRTPGIISSATIDLLGSGRAAIAIAYEFAMNEPKKGKLLLATQDARKGLDEPWQLAPIAEIGSIHRLRWGDVNGDKRPDLVVAPIFGAAAKPPGYQQQGAAVAVYYLKREDDVLSYSGDRIDQEFPVLHAIDVLDRDRDGFAEIYSASNLGVCELRIGLFNEWSFAPLVDGHQGEPPQRGASEVHFGRLKDGREFLATIEPWHGSEVVVYLDGKGPRARSREVIDATLADGHALWVADVDGDGDDEVFAGHRGKDHRVSMYDLDPKSAQWTRTVLDKDIAAQDLRGGDLDGDGTPDVVAVGGSTHNVVWYRFPRR